HHMPSGYPGSERSTGFDSRYSERRSEFYSQGDASVDDREHEDPHAKAAAHSKARTDAIRERVRAQRNEQAKARAQEKVEEQAKARAQEKVEAQAKARAQEKVEAQAKARAQEKVEAQAAEEAWLAADTAAYDAHVAYCDALRNAAGARKLLGVSEGASLSEIIRAHRQMAKKVHTDKLGCAPDDESAKDAIQEINAAADRLKLLLEPAPPPYKVSSW
ncbi:DnaJ domain-containing protein, partial [Paraburkholderia sediminicola]|uniref:DnaJ domain-containing protein n=1 Tax=Paraburkholderia sediminicola TaxID=458836 RepID=UPI0038BC360A